MKIIKRENYLRQVKPHFGKNVIKVLTGQRRVGKSYLLKQIMEIFEASDQKINIIYIDTGIFMLILLKRPIKTVPILS